MPQMPKRMTNAKDALLGTKWCRWGCGILVAIASVAARADDDKFSSSMFSFSGFGTVGVVHSSEDQADFVSGIFKPDGPGHSRAWSADVDSRLGAQLTAQFTPELSAVLQVVAQQQYDNTYTPYAEWANIKYAFSPDFSIRAGRIVLPVFLFSDTFNVGYAYPWARPPIELYRILPASSMNGVDVSYRMHFGDWTHLVRAQTGWEDKSLSHNGGKTKARRSWGVTDTIDYDRLTVQVSYNEAHLTATGLHSLFNGFRQFGAQGNALADQYDLYDKLDRTISAGFNYDPGDWFTIGEWGRFDSHSALGGNTAWYLSSGYRMGKFTPYLSYSRIRIDKNTSDPGLDVSTLPPFLIGPAIGLNAALNGILASSPGQQTISVGVRWDFMKDLDLKAQFDHSRLDSGSPGLLVNQQPGFQPGGSFNVFSATLDFVF